MKRAVCLLSFVIFLGQVHSQNNVNVTHYRFDITLSDRDDTIRGEATIDGKILNGGKQFSLDLAQPDAGSKGKGLVVTAVKGTGVSGFKQSGNKVIIDFSTAPADTFRVALSYQGIPSDGLIIGINKFGQRCFFADNWPNRAHFWIPCNDVPGDKSSAEFVVTAPDHYQVVSNGIKIEETELGNGQKLTHWKETVELPTKVLVIGVADFSVSYYGDVNNVPVYSWVFTANKDQGYLDYSEAKEILAFYMNYIGPFPYRKLANVQSKTIFGGMENASAIFYFENSVTGKQKDESLLAHEIAHQWFGDMATETAFSHLWLSEGFATYMTHIYIESKYGTDSLNKEMQKDRREANAFAKKCAQPVVDSVSSLMDLLNANSYQKGGWVLHMLRRQLGDSVFHLVIRTYYDRFKGRNANTGDFKAVAEEVSGKDLGTFFHQWLYTPGVPKLAINWHFIEKDKSIELSVTPDEKTVGFPLEVEVQFASGTSIIKTLEITNKTQTLTWQVPGAPSNIIADPHVSCLAEISIESKK